MKSFVLIILLFATQLCSAQKEANIWYFGNYAGMDFNSGSPVVLTNSAMNTGEGCAVISDVNGNLRFYTDGVTVWNANHAQMPNGNGLLGNYSSSQSALIVPQPGSSTILYIFTTAADATGGFTYSIVDMTLQGGLGDVTTKNSPLVTPVGEKLTGCQKTGSNDIWIVVHEYNSANFYSYLLTSTGVNPPVITSVGQVHTGFAGDNAIGWMKISPTGNKLALALSRSDNFELFDFDAATGIVSNPIVLPVTGLTYGIEFSQDGSLLYAGIFANEIYQYDLTLGTAAAIIASQILVGTSVGTEIGALEMAPDGKIYVARNTGAPFIGVINNPSVTGTGCNYVDNGFDLSPNICAEGLPNFLPTFFLSVQPPVAAFSVSDSSVCPGTCVDYTNMSVSASSYQWIFNGAVPSSDSVANPVNICYSTPGSYDVTLIATNISGSDTLTFSNYITVFPAATAPSVTQAGDTLFATQGFVGYQWYFGSDTIVGATNYFYVATQDGNYNLIVTDENGCSVGAGILNVVTSIPSAIVSPEPGVSVFPNPANDKITVTMVNRQSSMVSIDIYNSIGEKVYSSVCRDTSCCVSTSDFSTGIYLVKITSAEIILTKKIIIEK